MQEPGLPAVDMAALELGPDSRLVTIASGGCNVLAYLTANPRQITAVDLNRAHIALTRIKLAAAMHLPNYDTFYRFSGDADRKATLLAYKCFLRDRLDPETLAYWQGRDLTGRGGSPCSRATSITTACWATPSAWANLVARLYGIDLKALTRTKSQAEQRSVFERTVAPPVRQRLVRWITGKRVSLYRFGIPPAQDDGLAAAGDMAAVLRQRVQQPACGFAMAENYFAWHAFCRGYACESGPLPPYVERTHFDAIRERGPGVGPAPLGDRAPGDRARAKPRCLCAARCPGLDERCPAERAVVGDEER